MARRLNLNAHVPGVSDATVTSGFPTPNKAFPVSAEPLNKEQSSRKPDYVPAAQRRAAAGRSHMQPKRRPPQYDGFGDQHVVRITDRDYLPAAEAAQIQKRRGQRIQELASEIYEQAGDDRRRWQIACEILDAATDEEINHPTGKVRRALDIKAKGPPLTREQAMEQARKQMRREV